MNLSYKAILIGVLCWLPWTAQALNLTALYQGACKRSLGVILEVGDERLTLLDLEGHFQEIRRFEVVYAAYYPVGQLPLEKTERPLTNPLKISTIHQNELQTLAEGWAIDFSEAEISFLTLEGREIIIQRDSIWDIEELTLDQELKFQAQKTEPLDFVHPYPFAHCNGHATGKKIYPQQLLADPFMIKREFDRLETEDKVIHGYQENKVFYPVPQVYSNHNSLGLWMVSGSRYGSSRNRVNSFIPSFVSELSEGPYGFQRILVTGTAPMPYSLHEEPQSQFYYRLKADYVHFSIMYDFDRLLLGEERFKWSKLDLGPVDFRLNELQHISAGYDYGHWSAEYAWTPIQYGVNVENRFFKNRVDLNQLALRFQNRSFMTEFHYGFAVDGKVDNIVFSEADSPEMIAQKERLKKEIASAADYLTDIRHYRINLDLKKLLPFSPEISYIGRKVDYTRDASQTEAASRLVQQTHILALWVAQELPLDLRVTGFLSGESAQSAYGQQDTSKNQSKLYFKGGAKLDLTF